MRAFAQDSAPRGIAPGGEKAAQYIGDGPLEQYALIDATGFAGPL